MAFRGTNGAKNWVADLSADQDLYLWNNKSEVHRGFYSAYQLLQEDLRQSLAPIIDQHPFSTILVTGHSLGGALALLAALDIKLFFGINSKMMKLYTFGQPRVGDKSFSEFVSKQFN